MTALPSKLGARRRRRRIFLAVAVPLLILSLFGGLVALSRWSGITISTIEVEGASAVPEEELIASTEGALRGNYLWLFPKGNIFLYPRRVAEQALRREFPTLRSADLSFVNLHTLLLSVEERKLYALWCGMDAPGAASVHTAADQCLFLDEEGFLFPPEADFTGAVYLRYYGGGNSTLGAPILPPEEFKQLLAFVRELPALSLAPVSVALLPEKDVEVHLESGSALLLSRNADYAVTLDNLRSALSSDAFKEQPVHTLEYLDLRFGDRVFFKFKD